MSSVLTGCPLQGVEAYDKQLYYKKWLILIKKNKQQNKKIDTKSKFTQYVHHFFQLLYQHAFEMIC